MTHIVWSTIIKNRKKLKSERNMAGYWTEDKMDSMIVEYRSTYGNVDEMCYSDHAKKDRYE